MILKNISNNDYWKYLLIILKLPVLMENLGLCKANKAPDLDIIQRTGSRPVDNDRLGKLVMFNLRRTVVVEYASVEDNSLCKCNQRMKSILVGQINQQVICVMC